MGNLEKNNNSVNIVYATNNNYIAYLAVSLASLIDNTSPDRNYRVIILETDVSDDNKNKILSMQKENIDIDCVNTTSVLQNFNENKLFCHMHFSKEMYLRLFIPDILNEIDKAIYLDCDTIIESDIAELFDIDISQFYIAAAKDFNSIINYDLYPNVKLYFDSAIKIPDINKYFNSGVLLMNLSELRKENLPQKAGVLLDYYKEFLYPDQDLLNLICANKVLLLSNCWNYVFAINPAIIQSNKFVKLAVEYVSGLQNQKIVHYISEHKPWDLPEMFYADIWWAFAKKSPFYQELLAKYFEKHPEKLPQK